MCANAVRASAIHAGLERVDERRPGRAGRPQPQQLGNAVEFKKRLVRCGDIVPMICFGVAFQKPPLQGSACGKIVARCCEFGRRENPVLTERAGLQVVVIDNVFSWGACVRTLRFIATQNRISASVVR